MVECEVFIQVIMETKTLIELEFIFDIASQQYKYIDEAKFTLIQQACLDRKFILNK